MSEPQRIQLFKSKRDAAIDLTSLIVFMGMLYFAMHPDKYERIANEMKSYVNKVTYKVSVWQTTFSIRSLPETDE